MSRWFEEYENEPILEKSQIPWKWTTDFQVQGAFIVNSLRDLTTDLSALSDEQLLHTSQYCFNLLSWIKQMEIMGFTGLPTAVNDLLKSEFNNSEILQQIQSLSLNLWLKGKNGQYKIGDNTFTIKEESIYYRNLFGNWFSIDKINVFHIFPAMHILDDDTLIQSLNENYQLTHLDELLSSWKNLEASDELPPSLASYIIGESTPEDYLALSKNKIAEIIKNPVSFNKIRSLIQDDAHLEKLIKCSYLMSNYVIKLRNTNNSIIYLLRDCLSFYEIHHTFNILDGKSTSFEQLYVGRNIMTNKKRPGGHWLFTQNALFNAYKEHPSNFELFYKEYSQILREYEDYSEEFAAFIKDLLPYIKNRVEKLLKDNQEITIVDLGFQGSINLFIKYVIENHLGYKKPISMNIYVSAEWFKGLYAGMYSSNTYSLLTVIEDLDRNERLFEYKNQSLKGGEISVIMGSEDDQKRADIELIINTTIAKLMVQLP